MAFVGYMILTGIIGIAGFFVSPFVLLPIYQIVPCLMFFCRKIGIVVLFPKIRTAELVGDILITVLGLFLHKITLLKMILLILLRALFLLIVWYEDKHYIYIEEDI